jgi:hypothetical protein
VDDTRESDLAALHSLRGQVTALSDAMRVRFEPVAHRLASQGLRDAEWLSDELRFCRTAPDTGTLATVSRALTAVLEGE